MNEWMNSHRLYILQQYFSPVYYYDRLWTLKSKNPNKKFSKRQKKLFEGNFQTKIWIKKIEKAPIQAKNYQTLKSLPKKPPI